MQRIVYFTVHFLFWTTFLALSWMSISSNAMELEFMKTHLEAPFIMILWGAINFYSFYFYVQPLLLDTKKFVPYLLVSLALSLAISLLFTIIFWLAYPAFRNYAVEKFFQGMAGSFLISQCGSLLRGFISWNQNLQNKTDIENQSLRNELAMLKAQLSPHFLFNTLNNIDSLIYKSQDEASAMLIKLSGLLRYMLYESENREVVITQEIEYIQQLTELQRLRFEDENFIHLQINNACPQLKIAPLLFLPFIENAFKFVSTPTETPAITIKVDVEGNMVRLACRNHFVSRVKTDRSDEGGIGLANARRRLELLYSNRFNLRVSTTGNIFVVDLSIQIA
jgi:two-component system, LytTR family, sensor kinase